MSGGEQDAAFQLKSDGSKVTGTMTGPDGKEHPVTAGTLEGDKIALTIASEWEGNPVTLKVAGTVAGDMMKVTIQTEGGEWSTEATLKKL